MRHRIVVLLLQLRFGNVRLNEGRFGAPVLDAAAKAERRCRPRAERVLQFSLERGKPAVPERLHRADHGRVARLELPGDLRGGEEDGLLAVLREERRDTLLRRAEGGTRGRDPLVEGRRTACTAPRLFAPSTSCAGVRSSVRCRLHRRTVVYAAARFKPGAMRWKLQRRYR